MKKLLLISVLLGTLVFGQKNNHSTQASPTVQQISTETSSVSATVPRRLSYQVPVSYTHLTLPTKA